MAGAGFSNRTVIHGDKLASVIRSPNGQVMRQLLVQAERVRLRATELCGRSDTPGPDGHLADTIVKRVKANGSKAVVEIGSEHPRALMHHEGTQPHVIAAVNGPRLVFYWARVGSVVAFPRVNHPGTRPNRFLTDALKVL